MPAQSNKLIDLARWATRPGRRSICMLDALRLLFAHVTLISSSDKPNR